MKELMYFDRVKNSISAKKGARLATFIPWLIFAIVALFYCDAVLVRMLPSTMADSFMRHFDIGTTQFGIFTALYYYTYTAMQIPAGLMADKFSLKKIILVAITVITVGILLQAFSGDLALVGLGRLITGFGSAFAYISALKTASRWLPEKRFGLASCATDTIGMISGLTIGLYITKLNITMGVTTTYVLVIAFGALIAGLIWLIMKDHNKVLPHTRVQAQKVPILKTLARIAKNKQIWLIGLVGCLFYIPSSVFLDAWGIPYLSHVYHVSLVESSRLTSLFTLGWVALGSVMGFVSDKIKSRKLLILVSTTIAAVLFSLVIVPPYLGLFRLSTGELAAALFIIGVCTSAHPLVFALAKENFPRSISATVVACTNMIIMIGGIVFQPLVGYLINYSKHLRLGAIHSHTYTAADYSLGMLILPIFLLISIVATFFIKDSLQLKK